MRKRDVLYRSNFKSSYFPKPFEVVWLRVKRGTCVPAWNVDIYYENVYFKNVLVPRPSAMFYQTARKASKNTFYLQSFDGQW